VVVEVVLLAELWVRRLEADDAGGGGGGGGEDEVDLGVPDCVSFSTAEFLVPVSSLVTEVAGAGLLQALSCL
jgi:hypothetical protein